MFCIGLTEACVVLYPALLGALVSPPLVQLFCFSPRKNPNLSSGDSPAKEIPDKSSATFVSVVSTHTYTTYTLLTEWYIQDVTYSMLDRLKEAITADRARIMGHPVLKDKRVLLMVSLPK